MKEQSVTKNQSKEDRNHGIKHKNENQYSGCFLLLHLQSAKIKIAPATMNCKSAMRHIYFDFHSFSAPP
jgi:hypothetical protein